MMQLLSFLKQVLKGDVRIDINDGVMTYRGVRIVAIPAPVVALAPLEVANLFGESSLILFERVGESVGIFLRELMGWRGGSDVLKELPNIAKVSGFGKTSIKENSITMENLPLSTEDSNLLAYMRGFLRGLCIELEDVQASGNSLRARFKLVC